MTLGDAFMERGFLNTLKNRKSGRGSILPTARQETAAMLLQGQGGEVRAACVT